MRAARAHVPRVIEPPALATSGASARKANRTVAITADSNSRPRTLKQWR